MGMASLLRLALPILKQPEKNDQAGAIRLEAGAVKAASF
jgi:hypothetical protein